MVDMKEMEEEESEITEYERLLRRAKTEDLSEVSGIGCLYQCGVDIYGRPVIIFVGKWFKFKEINLDKVMYNILPYKYKKNLKAFYIVHPTFWTKMVSWWFTTFMAPAIKEKVFNIDGIEYLYSIIIPNQLEIPAYITEYDMSVSYPYSKTNQSIYMYRLVFRHSSIDDD
ncbi:ganglioside induced differentiation associated protein, putative [Pediculus humanus corporis]|uniref:Ganglioside induced differentiation associated protein, putative n=1 Tax=Pediculus humanus subsp. corporis TaxID=121224 RepID=E0VU15_PEDHC|nr:ganglioside induced differentiation associated protein, putative [Pediculus humanus corporis]EEB16871.1 ganglioside induced differentiation associated protein, putative [Pediculus humanus corporis]